MFGMSLQVKAYQAYLPGVRAILFVALLPNAQCFTLCGTILFTICFLIVGPVSFLNFKANFWVVVFSQFLFGLGMAAEIVSSFTHGMKCIIDKGFPQEVGTYSVISGVLFSSGCFGAFIGPSVGGFLIDHLGYITSTEIVCVLKMCVAIICGSRLVHLYFKKRRKLEIRQDTEQNNKY